MKMHPPGLLFSFLATWFISTAEGQSQKLKSMKCNVKMMFTMASPCTSCAVTLASRALCPRGWLMTTHGPGERGCRYTVKLGEETLSLPGCSHMCKKEIEEKKCCPGFWGTECYECPGGSENPCSGHGTCLDGITRNGTCVCEGQFGGFACQDCLHKNLFGPDCQSVCDCKHGVCNHGITGDGRCTCYGGYTGPKCDQELPHCQGLSCGDTTQCVMKDGKVVCDCKPGYQKSGSICQAQDPCASSPCSSLAVCKVLGPGKYECTCKEGYHGDGMVCQLINPCVNNNGGCPENSTLCIYKAPGKVSCVCKPGMTGQNPSAGCSPISECQRYYCDSTSKCEIGPDGTARCVCPEGEIGDGRSCYKNLMSEISQLNRRGRWFRKLEAANKIFASGCSLMLTKYGPFTVLVPTLQLYTERTTYNDTVAQQLCKMHIIPGQHLVEDLVGIETLWTLSGHQLTFNSQSKYSDKSFRYEDLPGESYVILQSNVPASNGIIHIVNALRRTTKTPNLGNPQKTIGEILASAELFSRFETILENCGLPSILDGPGPFTVFVPSNDGVDKLRDGRLIYLFTKGINKLQELVKHHIYTSAAVTVDKLVTMPRIITMANQILTINVSKDGRILMDDSGISLKQRDIVASNGIIHTLDGIFIPPSIVPILPHRCDEEQHKIIAGSCVDCEALNTSVCPPLSTKMAQEIFASECVYVHDPLGLNVLKKGCARYCNQTIMKPGCCKGFFGPDCTPCPGGFSNPCYGRGNCSDGIQGNGNCLCFEGFKGIACHICSNPHKHGKNCDEDCGCVHGICDNRPGSGGVCQSRSCKEGYTGDFCDKSSQNCGPIATQYCHRNAVCSLNNTARCICTDGYEGDGFSCLPIDLCGKPERGGCSKNAICTSTGPGTATCQCHKGWTGDGKACVAIDNCVLETRGGCHIHADCSFVGPGQSKCVCKRGYAGDGYSCDPIDPCKLDNGGCHGLAVCESLGGGERSCTCALGYMGDGFICYGGVLQELARNSQFASFYEWIQKSLFSIPAGVNVTVLVPSEAAIKNLSKAEKDFWLMPYVLPFLVRAHFLQGSFTQEQLKAYKGEEIPTLNPRTRWEITNSSGTITIQNAAIVVADIPAINGTIYIINQVLLPPLGDIPPSRPGLQQQLDMVPSFSVFKELLAQYQLIEKIESSEKYTIFVPGNSSVGEYCRASNITQLDNDTVQYHVVLGEKLSSADLKSGVHKAAMLGFSYWLLFHKNNTQMFVNNVPFDGKFFETKNGMLIGISEVLRIQKNRCTANTTVIQKSKCAKCDRGIKCPYGSVLAETPGEGQKPHCVFRSGTSEELGCYFTCIKVSLVSVCCPGYYGHMCEMCPGKPGSVCSGSGVCLDGIAGSGECRCHEGFHGTACEMCEVGRYGADCKSVCACRNGLCNDGLHGDGSCECFQGWEGITCERRIGVDLCNNTCHLMANCINGSIDSLPTCSCSAGYTGNGTYCSEINPCEVDNGGCSIHATCTNVSPGENTCTCKEGYSGDGTLCQEIDGCLEQNGGCHRNAECIKTGPNLVDCNCLPSYSGDGRNQCVPIDICIENNGGCSPFASCKYTGPGTRNCSCRWAYVGDGFTCRGKVYQELLRSKAAAVFVKQLLAFKIKELNGEGPFTVFVPHADSIQNSSTFAEWTNKSLIKDLLRYHIVSCRKLLASELETQESITALSGHKIRIAVKENSVHLNEEATIITSDIVGTNGVIHITDKILIPFGLQSQNISSQLAQQNITEVAEAYGYKIYSKLLQEAELLPLVNNFVHRPFTMLWPTDAVFNALPEKMQTWLYSKDHRDKLAAYLKMHMIRDMKVVAGNMPHIDSVRTMHGSTISFSCSKSSVGELLVDNGNARIVQRHMEFNGGIAYGIDQLLEPPNLGSRCDEFLSVELQASAESCGTCGFEPPCPTGSTEQGKRQACFYYASPFSRFSHFTRRNYLLSWYHGYPAELDDSSRWTSLWRTRGCRRTCFTASWVPQCCANHYGRDCQVCPGGLEAPCSNHGTCNDGIGGSGRCNCTEAFIGTACELCAPGRHGPSCQECECTENGMCNEGLHGDGVCFCTEGWTGERCETKLAATPVCSPACHPNASCRAENVCECSLHYEGDGRTCTVIDRCQTDNGGCSEHANCTQTGVQLSCTCLPDYQGDGYVCSPRDRCADGRNGDCSEHALCTSTGPNTRKCECKPGYVGNGVQCLEEAVPPADRCLEGNGHCHREAVCTDLHFYDKMVGVFHLQSPRGKYGFTYAEAEAACMAEDAALATVQQLSAAQQMGYHLCLVGWLSNGTAGYPTVYPTPSCGSSHVGIVDYGTRKNLTESWDAFCYRAKDVRCTCRDGFIGDGYACSGHLLAVLAEHADFSTFYAMLLDYTNATEDGLEFFNFLAHNTTYKTLFVPLNSGFAENMTLTWEELKLHVSMSDVLLLSFNLTNGTVIPSCSGYNLLIADAPVLNSTQPPGSKVVNNTLIVQWDILAFNGIIHAIAMPLRIPRQLAHLDQVVSAMKSSHPVTIGVTSAVAVVLLLLAVAGVAHYYPKIKNQGFQFHYFQADLEEDEQARNPPLVSFPNPVFGAQSLMYEPFEDSFNGEDFSDTYKILE